MKKKVNLKKLNHIFMFPHLILENEFRHTLSLKIPKLSKIYLIYLLKIKVLISLRGQLRFIIP